MDGEYLFVLAPDQARVVAGAMMGVDASDAEGELSEIELSAVGEAMNQMMAKVRPRWPSRSASPTEIGSRRPTSSRRGRRRGGGARRRRASRRSSPIRPARCRRRSCRSCRPSSRRTCASRSVRRRSRREAVGEPTPTSSPAEAPGSPMPTDARRRRGRTARHRGDVVRGGADDADRRASDRDAAGGRGAARRSARRAHVPAGAGRDRLRRPAWRAASLFVLRPARLGDARGGDDGPRRADGRRALGHRAVRRRRGDEPDDGRAPRSARPRPSACEVAIAPPVCTVVERCRPRRAAAFAHSAYCVAVPDRVRPHHRRGAAAALGGGRDEARGVAVGGRWRAGARRRRAPWRRRVHERGRRAGDGRVCSASTPCATSRCASRRSSAGPVCPSRTL